MLPHHNLLCGVVSTPLSSGGSPPAGPFAATVTVGAVTENLTGYPLFVRLEDMPSSFWSEVDRYGYKIRAYDDTDARLPLDVVHIDARNEKGVIFIKTPLSTSGTTVTVRLDGVGRVAPNDTYGQYNVWSDYAGVALFGYDGLDRTGKTIARGVGDPDWLKGTVLHTFTEDLHQGGDFDGTHYYMVDTNAIYKFDLSWTLVASNLDPIGDTGLPVVNHCGDPCVKDGLLYIPLEYYETGSSSDQHIVTFDTETLSFVAAHDVSSGDREASSICYCPVDGNFYITDYIAGKVHKWSSTFSYVGEFSLNVTATKLQGIVWWQERFWIVDDDLDEVFPVDFSGNSVNQANTSTVNGVFGKSVTGALEGIFVGPNGGLCVHADPSSGNSYVTEYMVSANPLALGLGWQSDVPPVAGRRYSLDGLSNLTTFTIGVSGAISDKSANRCIVSYEDWTNAGSPNDRISVSYQSSTSKFGVWDDLNTWMYASPDFNPTVDAPFRLHTVYEGTTRRKMYVDGVLRANVAGISAHTSGMDRLTFFEEDGSSNEMWYGSLGYGYIRSGVLSDGWIATEFANLNAPATFYTIAEIP